MGPQNPNQVRPRVSNPAATRQKSLKSATSAAKMHTSHNSHNSYAAADFQDSIFGGFLELKFIWNLTVNRICLNHYNKVYWQLIYKLHISYIEVIYIV